MINNATEIIKIFFEKYLFQSVLSIFLSILLYVYFPNIFFAVQSKGELLHFVFLFSFSFIIFSCITVLLKVLVAIIDLFINDKSDEKLRSYVDNLGKDDRRILNEFINSNNKKIYVCREHSVNYFLKNEELFVKSKLTDFNKKKSDYFFDPLTVVALHYKSEINEQLFQFKLQDNIYKHLKYLKKKYGKISHFD